MLRRGKTPIEIGGRAFDLLMTLLGSPGEIVPKERIMQQVWPTTTVDESNLRFQMTCLRRILGSESRRIKTIPGRGYIFIVHDRDAEEASWLTASGRAERPPIVIIDGDPESRAHLSRLLAAAGARVESFATVTAFLAESKIVERPGRTAPTEAMAA
jgi:DNA-binding winged helix-turn-helix (wHTH) protein